MAKRVPDAWLVAAAAILMGITMGSRSSFGLFTSPLNTATGLGVVTISFAVAANQLLWGAAQPVVGALADRHGPARVIAAGGLLLALGCALVPFAHDAATLVFAFALIAVAGAAAGSNALLMGAVGRAVRVERRGLAMGVVGAGGSAGQLVLAPLAQGTIDGSGWVNAMLGLAALALLSVPLAAAFRRGSSIGLADCGAMMAASSGRSVGSEAGGLAAAPTEGSGSGPKAAPAPGAVGFALRSAAFWCLAGGFFVCGFHVAFLLSHMPGEIRLCGLPAGLSGQWIAIVGLCNIVGSVAAGLAIRRGAMRRALFALYGLRALGVALFIALPKSELTIFGFAIWMGLTYMATLPPTTGLTAQLFGVERLGTLFGLIMLAHQAGAFLGVWLGGIVLDMTGSFDWMWRADIALALVAAAIHLPLRETAPPPSHAVMPMPAAAARA